MEDFERCYRAVKSRDARFDGWFFTAVTSTGIYCRPSCPALTPKRENVRFYPTSAAAQQAGFRACLRCRPDAAPGSPAWLGRADVAARAVRLVFDGVVDRQGVSGLARRLGYSERQLHRVLVAEVGTGALSLARAQRAQTARLLLETTELPVARVAFAAGFTSVRQCNDTVRAVFARTPTELRHSARRRADAAPPATRPDAAAPGAAQTIAVRLAYRRPFAAAPLLGFLGLRAVPGVESFDGTCYRRALALPHGPGAVELRDADGFVQAVFHLADVRDLTTAIARCRHLCNLDADPVAVDGALGEDRALRPLVRAAPGVRVPGAVDGFETAVRAVIGQQVSVSGARTIAAGLCQAAGRPLGLGLADLERTFPDAEALAALAEDRPEAFPLPAGRRRALAALAGAVAGGDIEIDGGVDPAELARQLEELPGIGPWTSSYVALRAVGDPDAFLAGDLGARRGAARLGLPDDPASLTARAEQWRPWRAYALMHLWGAASTPTRSRRDEGESAA
ncbi:MAG: DNA-3-methyladenine glycosylase 2 family protein [Acidimicrobiales bacterium]